MTTLNEWKAPFQVSTGDASVGRQTGAKVIGLANGWFMIAWSEQFGDGAPADGEDIVAKVSSADGLVVFDSFGFNGNWTEGDQFTFDLAPTYDGLAMVYTDADFPDYAIRIERTFEDLTYVFGSLTNFGGFFTPQIAANLTPDNDDIFIVYENSTSGSLDARIIDENDSFSSTFSVLAPGTVVDQLRVDDAIVLSNGNFASLLWNAGANYVSILSQNGTFITQIFVATNSAPDSEVARDLASLADGGFVVTGEKFSDSGEIFARIYDNDGTFVTEITPIEVDGFVVEQPRVVALPDGGFVIMFEAGSGRFNAQVFSADGTSDSDPVLIGDGGFFGTQPEVSVTADGRVVFVWNGEQGTGLNTENFSSIWDPREIVIDPDDYGQIRANFVSTNVVTTGMNGSVVLEGESGDVILGQLGNDTIHTSGAGEFWGGDGDDTFVLSTKLPGVGENRYINGEDGNDLLDASGLISDWFFNLSNGGTSQTNEEIIGIERVISGSGNDEIVGSAEGNVLDGGAGADTLSGGLGSDTYYIDSQDDLIIEADGEGDDEVISRTHVTLRPHLERVVLNGDAGQNLNVVGNALSNIIFGDDGDNRLDGKFGFNILDASSNPIMDGPTMGNDTLIDRDGGDVMIGGDGDDFYRVSGDTFGLSSIFEQANGGHDTLITNQSTTVAANVETVRLYSAANLDVTGNDQNNEVNGNNGSNEIMGLEGNDTLRGAAGADTIEGGAGNDTLRGGNGNDVLNGDDDNDVIRGEIGADTLNGGAGNDRLFGGASNDELVGGLGADIFVFNGDFANDRILDFDKVTDNDRLQFTGYEALNGGAALEFADFLIAQAGTRTRVQLDLDRDGVADVLDLDGDGDLDTARVDLFDFIATNLDATDFVL